MVNIGLITQIMKRKADKGEAYKMKVGGVFKLANLKEKNQNEITERLKEKYPQLNQSPEDIVKKVLPTAPKDVIEEASKVSEMTESYSRVELNKMKMKDLREIGAKFGLKDNIKTELIDKIIKASKKKVK